MATKLYIAINGTCTAGPDQNLFQMLSELASGGRQREFSEKLNRSVTGGGTALWVRSPSGIYMIDTGDYDDRKTLENSLAKIESMENTDPIKAVKAVYSSHAHGDHSGNNDLFPHATWMADNSDCLYDIIYGAEDTNLKWEGHREAFKENRKRGVTNDKFTYYTDNEHESKPYGLTIIDTPGHDKVHKSFKIEDDKIEIINLETGESMKTDKALFTGDCLCDKRYLQRFMDPDPEVQKTAIYGNAVPLEQWSPAYDQQDRDRIDAQNLKSMGKIVEEMKKGAALIFGHGGTFDYNSKL